MFLLDSFIRIGGSLLRIRIEHAFNREITSFAAFWDSGIVYCILNLVCLGLGVQYAGFWTRLARLFVVMTTSVLRIFPHLDVLAESLAYGIKSISFTILLFFIMIFSYSVLGHHLFGPNDPEHFGTLPLALITFFQLSTFDNFSSVMFINYSGCDSYPSDYSPAPAPPALLSIQTYFGRFPLPYCTHPRAQPVLSLLIFISFGIVVGYVIVNMCLAAVAIAVNERLNELRVLSLFGDDQDEDPVTTMMNDTEMFREGGRQAEGSKASKGKLSKLTGHVDEDGVVITLLEKVWASNNAKVMKKIDKMLSTILGSEYRPGSIWKTRDFSLRSLSLEASLLVQRQEFLLFMSSLILLDCLLLLYDEIAGFSLPSLVIHAFLQFLSVGVALMEVLAYGTHLDQLLEDSWALSDAIISPLIFVFYLSSVPPLHYVASTLVMLRAIRVLKICNFITDLGVVLGAIEYSYYCMLFVLLLVVLFFFLMALAGILLFRDANPRDFRDIGVSLRTLFQVMILDNWSDIMRQCMYGCKYMGFESGVASFDQSCDLNRYSGRGVGWWSALYFVIFIILAAMVLASLLVGVIITSMELLRDGMQEEVDAWKKVRIMQRRHKLEDHMVKMLLQIFEKVDNNGNGTVTLREVKHYFYLVNIPPKDQLNIFMRADIDKNGALDFAEFCELILQIGRTKASMDADKAAAEALAERERLEKHKEMLTESARLESLKAPNENKPRMIQRFGALLDFGKNNEPRNNHQSRTHHRAILPRSTDDPHRKIELELEEEEWEDQDHIEEWENYYDYHPREDVHVPGKAYFSPMNFLPAHPPNTFHPYYLPPHQSGATQHPPFQYPHDPYALYIQELYGHEQNHHHQQQQYQQGQGDLDSDPSPVLPRDRLNSASIDARSRTNSLSTSGPNPPALTTTKSGRLKKMKAQISTFFGPPKSSEIEGIVPLSRHEKAKLKYKKAVTQHKQQLQPNYPPSTSIPGHLPFPHTLPSYPPLPYPFPHPYPYPYPYPSSMIPSSSHSQPPSEQSSPLTAHPPSIFPESLLECPEESDPVLLSLPQTTQKQKSITVPSLSPSSKIHPSSPSPSLDLVPHISHTTTMSLASDEPLSPTPQSSFSVASPTSSSSSSSLSRHFSSLMVAIEEKSTKKQATQLAEDTEDDLTVYFIEEKQPSTHTPSVADQIQNLLLETSTKHPQTSKRRSSHSHHPHQHHHHHHTHHNSHNFSHHSLRLPTDKDSSESPLSAHDPDPDPPLDYLDPSLPSTSTSTSTHTSNKKASSVSVRFLDDQDSSSLLDSISSEPSASISSEVSSLLRQTSHHHPSQPLSPHPQPAPLDYGFLAVDSSRGHIIQSPSSSPGNPFSSPQFFPSSSPLLVESSQHLPHPLSFSYYPSPNPFYYPSLHPTSSYPTPHSHPHSQPPHFSSHHSARVHQNSREREGQGRGLDELVRELGEEGVVERTGVTESRGLEEEPEKLNLTIQSKSEPFCPSPASPPRRSSLSQVLSFEEDSERLG